MDEPLALRAASGLSLLVGRDGVATVGWGEPDWLGPCTFEVGGEPVTAAPTAVAAGVDDIGAHHGCELVPAAGGPAVRASVRAYVDEPLLVFRLQATTELEGIATGSFAQPSASWPHARPAARGAAGIADETRSFAFQYSEFAMPTHSDASMSRWFLLPHRPAAVLPLMLVAPDGRTVLVAPIDRFHDQVLGVASPERAEVGLDCGWHGDLDRVPAGFATEVAVLAGESSRSCIERWGALVRRRAGTARPGRYADVLGSRPSYWTDNGAAYWYRTEPGHDVPGTLAAAVDDLRAREVPVGAVQLDSWFYRHETTRPFDTEEWVVPPSGLLTWEPRDDILPAGLGPLRAALGGPPLAAHTRHLSAASPYTTQFECWVDGDRAHPKHVDLYERWLDQAAAWGVETFEHDWLIECFLGVRGLREEPGRAQAWQEGIDRAAAARGITLQWCMASPADFCVAASLGQVTSIRTSGDHGYIAGAGFLWAWFLYTNALARALGLHPFKDVFLADTTQPEHHSEIEALLSALSTGPVGVGDRVGRADPTVVRRTCRADGVLLKPDVPIAATSAAFKRHAVARPVPLVAETYSDHPAGRWAYVLTLNVHRADEALDAEVDASTLGDAAPAGDVVVWRWRERAGSAGPARWTVPLEPLGWDYRVLAPVLDSGVAVVGDPDVFATAADRRVGRITATEAGARFTFLGAGEQVPVVGWSRDGTPRARRWTTAGHDDLAVDALDDGWWRLEVDVPATGWADVDVVAPR